MAKAITMRVLLVVFVALTLAGSRAMAQTPADADFRAIWLTTVQGLDFPGPAGTSNITAQRQQIVDSLDSCQATGINAVVLQVRTECDAFYPSTIEPWSRWLTGSQGTAPSRAWDPLQFTVDECRRRGMEIHAWFNPYRAGVSQASSFSSTHPLNDTPDIVEPFSSASADYYWLNPGHPSTIPYTVGVIMDVVQRYDIDGIHFDDYFYPYGIDGSHPFPDSTEYNAYVSSGGLMSLGDWRRNNVNTMVATVDSSLAAEPGKGHVRFGISPFGIWKSGTPSGIVGLDAYSAIFADSRKWLVDGSVDYFAPQIYWGMAEDGHSTQQDFDTLLNWWTNAAQNPLGRQIFPGLAAYKALNSGWEPAHIVNEVNYQQDSSTANGSIFFRTLHLTMNSGQGIGNGTVGYLSNLLTADPYQQKATTPAYTHMDSVAPSEPSLAWSGSPGSYTAYWTPQGAEYPQWYVVYWFNGSAWSHDVLPDWQRVYALPASATHAAIQALDRLGNRSTMTSTALSGISPPVPTQLASNNVRNHDSDSLDFFTASGSNIGVTPSTDVATTNEANNRVDPRIGTVGTTSRSVPFTWTGASGGRYRLSTFGPNPQIDLTKGLGVYVKLLSGRIDMRLGIRETGGSGPIGTDGGSSGTIELTSAQRVTSSPNWQYLYFDIPNETYTSFTGNSALDGSWGVLECFMINQVAGAGTSFALYIDEIHQGGAHTPLGEPVRPRGLQGTPAGSGQVALSWPGSPAQDIAGYRIYRSTSPDVQVTTGNLVGQSPTPSFVDTTASPNTDYYYAVTAVDQFGYESFGSQEFAINSLPAEVSRFSLD